MRAEAGARSLRLGTCLRPNGATTSTFTGFTARRQRHETNQHMMRLLLLSFQEDVEEEEEELLGARPVLPAAVAVAAVGVAQAARLPRAATKTLLGCSSFVQATPPCSPRVK